MNWIERMYEIKGRDPYSQNGEGLYLEYIFHSLKLKSKTFVDIGSGDGFILSNTRHLIHLGFTGHQYDRLNGFDIHTENILRVYEFASVFSIDIDGNDYWMLDTIMRGKPSPIIIAEFNPAFTDSRAIKYNHDHVWAGDDYYGFTFEAGVKLAEIHGYKVIFQIADMNMIMVRKDLIEGLTIPPVTYKQSNFFKMSERTDWVII